MEEFLKKLAVRLGLEEGASEDEILTKLAEKPETTPDQAPVGIQLSELSAAFGMPETSTREDLLERANSARPPEITRRTQFAKQFPEEAKLLEETQKRLDEEEISRKLDEWHRGGEFGGLPPALDDLVKPIRKALPPSGRAQFDEFVGKVLNGGLVPLSEMGGTSSHVYTDESDAFVQAVKDEMQKNPNLKYEEAVRKVSRENRQLAEAYQKSVRTVNRGEVG